MKNKYKMFISVIVSFIILFCIGCSTNNKLENNNDNRTKVESKREEKTEKNKKTRNEEKTNRKEEKVKEQGSKVKKQKNEVEKQEKSELDINIDERNQISEEKETKASIAVEKSKEATVKNEVILNQNSKVDESKFTMIVTKESKGYTGKNEEVIGEFTLNIDNNKSAMTYLRENVSIKETGGFIYEINGIHNQYPIPESEKTVEQKEKNILGIDWFIYLNGEKTSLGANDVYPKEGDILLIDFHEWDNREFS